MVPQLVADCPVGATDRYMNLQIKVCGETRAPAGYSPNPNPNSMAMQVHQMELQGLGSIQAPSFTQQDRTLPTPAPTPKPTPPVPKVRVPCPDVTAPPEQWRHGLPPAGVMVVWGSDACAKSSGLEGKYGRKRRL